MERLTTDSDTISQWLDLKAKAIALDQLLPVG
jgi:hypothetical protein